MPQKNFDRGDEKCVETRNVFRLQKRQTTQCLKITEKVAFNIASEASYVYNLSGQKDKNGWEKPKLKNSNATFWVIFKHCGCCANTEATPQRMIA